MSRHNTLSWNRQHNTVHKIQKSKNRTGSSELCCVSEPAANILKLTFAVLVKGTAATRAVPQSTSRCWMISSIVPRMNFWKSFSCKLDVESMTNTTSASLRHSTVLGSVKTTRHSTDNERLHRSNCLTNKVKDVDWTPDIFSYLDSPKIAIFRGIRVPNMFFGPTQVHAPNDTLISSVVLKGLSVVTKQTNRHIQTRARTHTHL